MELLENKLLPEQQKHTVLALTSPCGPSPFYLTCVSFLLKVDTASPARFHLRSGSVGTGGWRTPALLKAVPHAVIWGSTGCLARLPLDQPSALNKKKQRGSSVGLVQNICWTFFCSLRFPIRVCLKQAGQTWDCYKSTPDHSARG